MNAHALGVLELSQVLALVADRATSELAADRVRRLHPATDVDLIQRELTRVEAMRALVGPDRAWGPPPIPALGDALDRLRAEGSIWSGGELRAAATLLASARLTRAVLSDERRPALPRAVLADVRERLIEARDREIAIERAIAEDGAVRDDASALLRRVRRELQGAEGELVALLERIMGSLGAHQRLPDMSVTVRNGRYVIPIRREARHAIGGIVHDTSATGATLFVEPPAAVEAGNRIRELEAEERREVDRILRDLADSLRPLHGGLVGSLDVLVELDTLFARARFADDFGCWSAELGSPGEGFEIRGGRHPLLVAQGVAAVPFDLGMGGPERTLLVSGPNTGGKTVLLKAVALCSLLVQCGVPGVVGPGSRVAIFDDVFADVGDEQSITASLSTFSAHVKNLGDILSSATASSLVLIDELGSGTDPFEGAALGGAVLEELTARGALTLATTHLGALKELASEVPGVVNASLQFDAVRLAPTYRLTKGVPGRSYGLSIARRLSLPEHVLARAEARVPQMERDVEALLADLEARAAVLAEQEGRVTAAESEAGARAARLDASESAVRERERDVERRSRQEARRYLLNARAQVEQTVRELRAAAQGGLDTGEPVRQARQRVEELAAEQGDALAALEGDAHESSAAPIASGGELAAVGDFVEVPTLGGRIGRLVDVRDGDAVVAVGAITMRVPAETLRRSGQPAPAGGGVAPAAGAMAEPTAAREIDLRGLRAAEVDEIVLHAIDAAIRADLSELRIIHGKGTGALRDRVGEMLRKDTRVRAVRLGAWNEGGAGVTVAELS